MWIICFGHGWELGLVTSWDPFRTNQVKSFGPCVRGRGVFSSVFRCKHVGQKTHYALKFVRSNKMMRKAAEREAVVQVAVLKEIHRDIKVQPVSTVADQRGDVCRWKPTAALQS